MFFYVKCYLFLILQCYSWVIPCEITQSKNESLPIVFILSTQSVYPMRFPNPEYQPPMTSGSRETECTNSVN